MKIHLAKYDPSRSGGGWAWQRTFANQSKIYPYEEADVYLISGASMVDYGEVLLAKNHGKKIVLRADNMPRRSRNSRWIDDQGKTKILKLAEIADLVIYQSQWARNMYGDYLGKDGPVILNGVDISIFNSDNRTAKHDSYLYARSSRDEGKNWLFAWYWFLHNRGTLEIAGPFSSENLDHNFDFYAGEKINYVGQLPDLINSYKRNKFFLYTYLNDAASNTLIEALWSGMEIIDVYGMAKTGGAPEILQAWSNDRQILSAEYMAKRYIEAIESIL